MTNSHHGDEYPYTRAILKGFSGICLPEMLCQIRELHIETQEDRHGFGYFGAIFHMINNAPNLNFQAFEHWHSTTNTSADKIRNKIYGKNL